MTVWYAVRRTRLASSALALAALCMDVGCEREARRFEPGTSLAAPSAAQPPAALRAGAEPLSGGSAGPLLTSLATRHGEAYQHNAWAMNNGKRLFSWFNCSGCHSQGGGGSGPALMDREWIYGHDLASIAQSIVHGRPNGMPAYGGKLSHDQVLQLAAYVRSLAGLAPMDAAPGRNDSMNVKDPEMMTPGRVPRARGGQP
jgi:cytochrome c oxidase cbb3-type subunit III